MSGNTRTTDNVIIKALFENIINALKNNDLDSIGDLPIYAIDKYYSKREKHFDLLQENFIEKYVNNESLVENVHSNEEKLGLKLVYEYIYSNYNDSNIDINYLLKLHEILYSKAPFPEAGGKFRTEPARLSGTVISLYPWEQIRDAVYGTNKWVNQIVKNSENVRLQNSIESILNYIDECLKLKCHLIQIHPFSDGNGRIIRAFINKLFILAGIPPIYVHAKEKEVYHNAMFKAITEEDFSSLNYFYLVKICQSIYELSINPNHDLKRKTDFKKIKKIVENYKRLMPENNHVNELSVHFAHSIKNELERENIEAEVCDVTGKEEYSYLMATLKDEQKQQDILIDPLFENYITQNSININPGLPFAQRKFLTSLYREGVAKAKTNDLEVYLETIGVLSKENTLHR
ncbi:MAG: Fic family protein [Bacilli bacterium]|nr:Fic family protein [Bacilli bacterium]